VCSAKKAVKLRYWRVAHSSAVCAAVAYPYMA